MSWVYLAEGVNCCHWGGHVMLFRLRNALSSGLFGVILSTELEGLGAKKGCDVRVRGEWGVL